MNLRGAVPKAGTATDTSGFTRQPPISIGGSEVAIMDWNRFNGFLFCLDRAARTVETVLGRGYSCP